MRRGANGAASACIESPARIIARAIGAARRAGRPTLLDLCCKAGGASVGYHRAGFDVVGVDLQAQRRYPFPFIQGDALALLEEFGALFDAVAASPPCQKHSQATRIRGRDAGAHHADLIEPMRPILRAIGRPWIMENVVNAPLHNPVKLCGTMFGLRVYRHRLFESSELLYAPPHPAHTTPCIPIFAGSRRERGGFRAGWDRGEFVTVAGMSCPKWACAVAMGIDWMSADELAQAIPPAYTEFLGRQLLLSALARPVAA